MDIEIRHVDDCPNWRETENRVRRLTAELGIDAAITVRRIDTTDEADRLGFQGSPTVLVDGVDPFALPAAPPALACRIYRTEDGLAGLPSEQQLRSALLG